MRIAILTIFPEIFQGFVSSSLIGKAVDREALSIEIIQIRDFADPPHNKVDDEPYGGGPGMVMKPEPLLRAIESAKEKLPNAKTILLSASGKQFTQKSAHDLSLSPELILVCGRYEGVDQRVIDLAIDEEYSVGDYVVMGGETPAMVVLEATCRLIPSILGNKGSIVEESYNSQEKGRLLEGPQYTRPAEFRGLSTPEVLLTGDHKKISEWRSSESLKKTTKVRPDLLTDSE